MSDTDLRDLARAAEAGGLAEATAYARAARRAGAEPFVALTYALAHLHEAAARLAQHLGCEVGSTGASGASCVVHLVRQHDGWTEYVAELWIHASTGTCAGRRGIRSVTRVALDDVIDDLAQPWAEARS